MTEFGPEKKAMLTKEEIRVLRDEANALFDSRRSFVRPGVSAGKILLMILSCLLVVGLAVFLEYQIGRIGDLEREQRGIKASLVQVGILEQIEGGGL